MARNLTARTTRRWTRSMGALFASLGACGAMALLAHCGASDDSAAPSTGSDGVPATTEGGTLATPPTSSDGGGTVEEDGAVPELPPEDDSGSPADAGPDANAPDASTFLGPSRCAGSGTLFCDAFEAATIDSTKWTLEKNAANTIALDTAQHARGKKSVRFHMAGTGTFQYAWLGTTKVFPQLKDHLFGRIFYRVEKLPTKNMHWTTIEASGPVPGQAYGAKMRYGGLYDRFLANYTLTTGKESAAQSTTAFPIAKWSCFEWEFERLTNTVRFWVDEVPLADVSVVKPLWIQPTYEKVNLGWQNYQANLAAPMDVWMDEAALDDSRIGCVK